MKSSGTRIVKATALLMALEGVEQVTALVKQAVIAAQFGTSQRMDAYVVATTVAGLTLMWVMGPINQVVLPMFRHEMARRGEGSAWARTSVLLNNLTVLLVALAGLTVLLAGPLVSLLAPGMDAAGQSLATSLTQIVVAATVFVGLGSVLGQVHFTYERFFTPGVAGTVDNLVLIGAFLFFASSWGIKGLAVSVVLGGLAELIIQLPILWKKRHLYRLRVDPRAPEMAEMGRLSLPLLFATGGTEVARITDRIFASLLPAGSLTALSYAQRLTSLQTELLSRPMMRSSFPHFARLSAEGDTRALSGHLFRYLRVMFFLTLPTTIAVMALSETVVRLLFQRGAFDETSVQLTSQALVAYTIGFPAVALGRILTRTFLTFKDTKTPTRLALLRIVIKVALAFALVGRLSHVGIALAESLSHILRLPLFFLALPRELRGRDAWLAWGSFGRTLIAGGAMAGAIWLVGSRVEGLVALPVEAAGLAALGLAVFGVTAMGLLRQEARDVLGGAAAVIGWHGRRGTKPKER
jgi:putative peptidoglycan lipid II flippase